MDNNNINKDKIIDNSILFFKIWRNIIIKNEIIEYSRVYHLINQDKPKFKSTRHIHDKYHKKYYDREICLDSMKPMVEGYEIPNTIISLDFSSKFNQDLTPGSIPSSVTKLRMGASFNKLLKPHDIPNSVETLVIGDRFSKGLFNQPLQHSIPSSVTDLTIYSIKFKQELKPGDFPSSIKSLSFGHRSEIPIDVGVLPMGLTELEVRFVSSFKPNSIPDTVTTLRISFGDKPDLLADVIPSSVTSLTLKNAIQNNIMDTFPQINSITYLEISLYQPLANSLSNLKQLKTLKFLYAPTDHELLEGDIPNSVTELELSYGYDFPISYGVLPMGLTSLSFGTKWNHSIWDSGKSVSILPQSITKLEFGLHWNQPIDEHYLPPNVTELVFGFYFNSPIINDRVLPKSIKSITFGYSWRQSSEFIILPNLEKLTYNPFQDRSWELPNIPKPFQSNMIRLHLVLEYYNGIPLSRGDIFQNVTTLDFGGYYNQVLVEGLFPTSLTSIKFGRGFNKPILPNVLPEALTSLSFGVSFNHPLDSSNLPQTLLKLTIDTYFKHSLKPLKSFPNLIIYRNNNSLKGKIYEINNG